MNGKKVHFWMYLRKKWFIWNQNNINTFTRPWCWEGLGAGGEGDDRGWNGWMVSPTPWTWVWVNSMSWWWTGRPGVLRFMGSQRVRHDWEIELNWTDSFPPLFGYFVTVFYCLFPCLSSLNDLSFLIGPLWPAQNPA